MFLSLHDSARQIVQTFVEVFDGKRQTAVLLDHFCRQLANKFIDDVRTTDREGFSEALSRKKTVRISLISMKNIQKFI